MTRVDSDPRSFPFDAAGTKPGNVLIIGAPVATRCSHPCTSTPATSTPPSSTSVNYRVHTDKFADYDGHFTDNPRVNYVNDEGRGYLARSGRK